MAQHSTQDQWESTHDWLLGALGGIVDGPATPMLARPSVTEANLLIPLAANTATAAALRRNHDDRTLTERLATTGGRFVGRLGLLGRIGGERIDFPMTRVVRSIQTTLGDPTLMVSIGVGPPRRNRKPVLMLIRATGEIAGYAKVGWSDFTIDLVENEFDLLTLVDGRLPEPLQTPAPIELIRDGEQVIAVCSAIPSSDWSRPQGMTPEQIDSIARSVGHSWMLVGDMEWLRAPQFGDRSDASDRRLEAAVASVADRFAPNKVEVGLWHGDLNPWNLISSPSGLGIVDWEFGGRDRPIGQDRRHLRFESLRRSGEADPATVVGTFVERDLASLSTPAELSIYLADLSIRESRLSGQGWTSAMAGYRLPLTEAIEGLLP
jgi:hypothetical protein